MSAAGNDEPERDLEIVVTTDFISGGDDACPSLVAAQHEPEVVAAGISAESEPLALSEAVDSPAVAPAVDQPATAGRRRPRRTRRRKDLEAPVMDDAEAQDTDQVQPLDVSSVSTAIAGNEVDVDVGGDTGVADADVPDDVDMSDAAAAIPFLRHRATRDSRTSDPAGQTKLPDGPPSQRDRKSRSRPRPRRRG